MTEPFPEPFHTLGTVGVRETALVDSGGAVGPAGGGWRVGWMVRSAQRWHRPADEASTRQELDDNATVVTTRVRLPAGDIEATVWVALGHDGVPHARLDVANPTAMPVGIAVILRGIDATGYAHATSLTAVDGAIRLGNTPVVAFDRYPRSMLAAADLDALLDVLYAEQDSLAPAAASSGAGTAAAAAVFPLAHGATLSASVSLRFEADAIHPSRLPSASSVAKGWDAHLGQGVRLATGDDLVDASLRMARRRLLTVAGDGLPPPQPGYDAAQLAHLRGALGLVLANWGFTAEAMVVRDVLALHLHEADAALASAWLLVAEAARRYADAAPPSAEEVAMALAVIDLAVRRPRRRGSRHSGLVHVDDAEFPYAVEHTVWAEAALTSAAASLDALGQPEASAEVAVRGAALRDRRREEVGAALSPLVGALGSWICDPAEAVPDVPIMPLDTDDAMNTVLALMALPRRFVQSRSNGFDVVARPVRGSNWELHDLPSRHGPLSIAVRWHGSRPALLWEHSAGLITASSFDSSWSDSRPSGEALLEI